MELVAAWLLDMGFTGRVAIFNTKKHYTHCRIGCEMGVGDSCQYFGAAIANTQTHFRRILVTLYLLVVFVSSLKFQDNGNKIA